MGGTSSSRVKLQPKIANLRDLPLILQYGEKFHKSSPWRHEPFDPQKVKEFAISLINDPNSVIFVHDGGLIGGRLVPLFFGQGLVMQELFWYADVDGGGLLMELETWAKRKGATSCLLSSLWYGDSRDERVRDIYSHYNYKPQEIHYLKEL